MASTFGGFEIARSGMMAYRAALETTAHNVANIETKGYSKQVTNMTSMVSNKSSLLVQGAGIWVTDIARRRDEYYDVKYQSCQSSYNRYNTEEIYLKEMENLLASGITTQSDNPALITAAFDAFNATLSSLVGKPNDGTIRRQCVTTAQTFTEFVNNAADKLQRLQDQANTQIRSCVEQINAYAHKITSLTKQINTVETYGGVANDLRDQRTLLVDELSQYCKVETLEKESPDGVGDNQFYVYMNGGVLIDTYRVNELVVNQKTTFSNINDIEGCYDIKWADGTEFYEHSSLVSGQLQGLFEIRDGNNKTTLEGTVKELTGTADPYQIKVADTNCQDVNKLNIPARDGEITISGHTYAYESFSVDVAADGSFTYTFTLRDKLNKAQVNALNKAAAEGYKATAGDEVDFRGIPYYMAQLNEFVRTYSEEFNTIHKQGYDGYGLDSKPGIDFFNAKVVTSGDNYVMKEKADGIDPSFQSVASKNPDGTYTGSYYHMTALNFCVTKAVNDDPKLIAAKGHKEDGSDNADILQKLTELKDDADMFVYGAPDSFIQAFTSTVGVDCKKSGSLSTSESNILYAIDTSRKSISGVDEDEEGEDMIIFQQMLFNQYKTLSVMAEVLDKLINQTAV